MGQVIFAALCLVLALAGISAHKNSDAHLLASTSAFVGPQGRSLLAGGPSSSEPKARVFASTGCIEKKPGPPRNLKGRGVNETAIAITWDEPLGNACVDTFEYYVVKQGAPTPRTLQTRRKSGYTVIIANLRPNTDYVVYVSAVNDLKGTSPSASTTIRTRKDSCRLVTFQRPGAVTDIKFIKTSPYFAYISWLPPSDGACALFYRIESFDSRTGRLLSRQLSGDADARVRIRDNTKYDYRITPISLLLAPGPTTKATLRPVGGR